VRRVLWVLPWALLLGGSIVVSVHRKDAAAIVATVWIGYRLILAIAVAVSDRRPLSEHVGQIVLGALLVFSTPLLFVALGTAYAVRHESRLGLIVGLCMAAFGGGWILFFGVLLGHQWIRARRERAAGLMSVRIRLARPEEGPRLKEIAIAAKSSWGYEAESVREWADQGDFSPTGLARLVAFVADSDGRAVGWASLLWKAEGWWLEDLWVEPESIGKGVGSRLFRHAAAHVRSAGAKRLRWEAEPNAVGFYERMGGHYLRDGEPTAFGRIIPVMGLELAD
jgi:GNAT superfamily N-acetyltransferase